MRLLEQALLLLLLAASRASANSSRLSCTDEAAQLFPLDIVLLDASGETLFSSSSSAAAGAEGGSAVKICYAYPFAEEKLGSKFATAWQSFRDLRTVQYVLPASLAHAGIASVRIISNSTSGGASFVSYYQAERSQSLRGIATHSYPAAGSTAGDPIHTSIFEMDDDPASCGSANASTSSSHGGVSTNGGAPCVAKAKGDAIMALWISFAEPDAAYDCGSYDHCCVVKDDIAVREKTPFLASFLYKNDRFTKTGSETLRKNGVRFSQAGLRTGTCDIAAPSWCARNNPCSSSLSLCLSNLLTLFFSVPSLSWQMILFQIEKRLAFFFCVTLAGAASRPTGRRGSLARRSVALNISSFPLVCPEPVLAKHRVECNITFNISF
eukprot:COSAG06_NODE_8448_length_2171_cov_2.210907_2_plen_381_part_00